MRIDADRHLADDVIESYLLGSLPFAEAEPVARLRASTVRRQAAINQWMVDIRTRADVVLTTP